MSQSAAPEQIQNAAVRRLIYSLAEPDYEARKDYDKSLAEAAGDAAERVASMAERIDALEAEVERLEDATPDADPENYDQMGKHEKAAVVRSKDRATAENTNGKAAMTYKDVIRTFDGRPSSGHAYDIMEVAGDADRFNYGDGPNGKRLTVDLV